jgi:hypothetical protein
VTAFGKLLAAPTDGWPVTKWTDPDDAFLDITKAIRAAVGTKDRATDSVNAPKRPAALASSGAGPRSSNLRMHKTFTELDRDGFLDEAFDFMARFSENALNELETRHPGIETAFKRIDARRFRNGSSLTRCNIRLGGLRGGIAFSYGGDPDDNSMNESLSVETD